MGDDGVELGTMTISEVAGVLRVDRRSVYRLVERGDLHAVRVGRAWRIPRRALITFLEDRQTTSRERT